MVMILVPVTILGLADRSEPWPLATLVKCQTSYCRGEFETAMETESGIFTAPRSGSYEVTFTGLLKSYNGNRVWSTLYKVWRATVRLA